MEAVFKTFTDPYERKARLYPALLAFLPVIIFMALYTEWLSFEVENALYIAVAAAVAFWLTGKSRDLGKAVERRLFAKWGGKPSVALLRHRDPVLDCYTTQRYHKAASLLAEITLPDPFDEKKDPADADKRYSAVTTALLKKTRNTSKYPLLFKENINYGFWRNLSGVKPIACLLAVALIALGLWLDRAFTVNLQPPDGNELLVVAAGIAMLFLWITTVTDASVHRAAQEYAKRLLEALDDQ